MPAGRYLFIPFLRTKSKKRQTKNWSSEKSHKKDRQKLRLRAIKNYKVLLVTHWAKITNNSIFFGFIWAAKINWFDDAENDSVAKTQIFLQLWYWGQISIDTFKHVRFSNLKQLHIYLSSLRVHYIFHHTIYYFSTTANTVKLCVCRLLT